MTSVKVNLPNRVCLAHQKCLHGGRHPTERPSAQPKRKCLLSKNLQGHARIGFAANCVCPFL